MDQRKKPDQFDVYTGDHRKAGLGWVEHYYFTKSDGTYYLHWGVGWHGGYHNDGASGANELPAEWFRQDWSCFLQELTKCYPEDTFGYGPEYLDKMKGIREFFGFE